jgi:AhpC/TSA family protein
MLATLLLAMMQQPTAPPPPPAPPALEVGAVAPDFAMPGATRYGTLKNPVRLSDYKGKTVVLAFFFKARTRG